MAGLCEARVQPRLFKRVWLSGNLRVLLGREQVTTVFLHKYDSEWIESIGHINLQM